MWFRNESKEANNTRPKHFQGQNIATRMVMLQYIFKTGGGVICFSFPSASLAQTKFEMSKTCFSAA